MLKNLFILTVLLSISLLGTAAHAKNSSPSAYVKYDLAYPGILPDNPLYKIKIIRDKITNFLITDPRRKVDFYLLQTDKGILATAMLIDKKNISLAEQTALRAEHNFTLLNNEFYRMPKKPDEALFAKLKTASLKHQEVLRSIIERLPEDQQKTFKQVLEFSQRNETQMEKFQKKHSQRWNIPD